jgi:hypothetical protein
MCSLMEHSARSYREEIARQQAEADTPESSPNNGELLGTSVKIVV